MENDEVFFNINQYIASREYSMLCIPPSSPSPLHSGLVTLEQMREKRELIVREREKQIAAKLPSDGYVYVWRRGGGGECIVLGVCGHGLDSAVGSVWVERILCSGFISLLKCS